LKGIDKNQNLIQVPMDLMNVKLGLEESINEEIRAILRDPINETALDEEVVPTRDSKIISIKQEVVDVPRDQQKLLIKEEKADSPQDPRKRPNIKIKK